MKKKDKKREKKKGILNKAKIALLAPFLSFIFTRVAQGYNSAVIHPMYVPPIMSPLEIASAIANFFAHILLIPSVLMAVVYIILKKRKSKKRWPKILLLIFSSLFLLSLIVRIIAHYMLQEYHW